MPTKMKEDFNFSELFGFLESSDNEVDEKAMGAQESEITHPLEDRNNNEVHKPNSTDSNELTSDQIEYLIWITKATRPTSNKLSDPVWAPIENDWTSYIYELNKAIYGETADHPPNDTDKYYQAAENYAVYGEEFLDFPRTSTPLIDDDIESEMESLWQLRRNLYKQEVQKALDEGQTKDHFKRLHEYFAAAENYATYGIDFIDFPKEFTQSPNKFKYTTVAESSEGHHQTTSVSHCENRPRIPRPIIGGKCCRNAATSACIDNVKYPTDIKFISNTLANENRANTTTFLYTTAATAHSEHLAPTQTLQQRKHKQTSMRPSHMYYQNQIARCVHGQKFNGFCKSCAKNRFQARK